MNQLDTIILALKFFGHMDKYQIDDKLRISGLYIELKDLDHALKLLINHKLIRKTDFDSKQYIAIGY